MAYLVLARKWRPQKWDEVVAQPHVTATMKNAIQHNRLAHAYLFTGPRGVGKTSAARILAKSLNCEKGVSPVPCNVCSNCVEIADGRNMDVFEIDGASNRGIDEVRNLRENIRYMPAKSKYRIYIIDEVHMLTTEAFNALLKTLEEPPSHVLFIFATTEPHRVPATILSRCQRFDFRRIGIQDIIHHLKKICQEEKIDIDETALHLIARKADGALRDSQSILDQMISFTGNRITAEDVIKALGLIEQEIYFEVSDVLSERDIKKGLMLIERVISGGYDLEEFLAGLMEHLRNLLVVKALGSESLTDVTENYQKKYESIADDFLEEDLIRLIRIVAETAAVSKRSLNPRIPLEMAMLRMIKLDKTVRIDDLLTRLNTLKGLATGSMIQDSDQIGLQKRESASQPIENMKQSEKGYTECKEEPEKKAEKKTQITLQEVNERWDEVIQKIKEKKITIGAFLQEGCPIKIEENSLVIGFGLTNGFHIDAIMRSKILVEEVIREVFQTDLDFRCVKGDFPQISKRILTKEDKRHQLKKMGEEDVVIQQFIDDFGIEIIE